MMVHMSKQRECITAAELNVGDECYYFQMMKTAPTPSYKKIGGVVAAIVPDDTYRDDGFKVWFKKDTAIAVNGNDHWIEVMNTFPSMDMTRVARGA